MTEIELKQQSALSLFAARRITLVQAAHLAEMNLFDFQKLLRDRRIPQHYDESDFEKDLETIQDLREMAKCKSKN